MTKPKEKSTRILIRLPVSLKKYLDDISLEGYTASGYIRGLILSDRKARIETGWKPGIPTHRLIGIRRRPHAKKGGRHV